MDALDTAVHEGDGAELASFAMSMVERNEDGTYAPTSFARSHLLVTCSDWPPSPWDSAVPSRDVLANHPLWARIQPPSTDPCDGWTGVRRETLLVGAEVATPVLVIGNDGDLDDAHRGHRGPGRGDRPVAVRHRRRRTGHGAYGTGNDCADAVVDDYLARFEAPEDDFRCGADASVDRAVPTVLARAGPSVSRWRPGPRSCRPCGPPR